MLNKSSLLFGIALFLYYLCRRETIKCSIMKQTKKTATEQEVKTPGIEVKKSKIRLYWEDLERRGIPKGVILNKAVLR